MGMEAGGLLGLLILAGDIWAIVSVLSSGARTVHKLVWILLIIALPLLGLILWLFLGPGRQAVRGSL